MKVSAPREKTSPQQRSLAALAERHEIFWLCCLSAFYFLVTSMRALRPFWYDELITLNLARLPTFAAVLDALYRGADLNPILFYVFTWSSVQLLGPTEFALRLPGLLGFWVFCLCLFFLIRRRAGVGFGLAAMVFPLLTGASYYAAEARAYGLVLGFSGLAVLSWQRAAEPGQNRRLNLFFLALSLSAALLTHCYAVLTLVPYGLAQLQRDIRNRSMDWLHWAAIVLPVFSVLSYLPLVQAVTPYAYENPIFRPSWHSPQDFWSGFIGPALWPLLAALLLALWMPRREVDSSGQSPASETTLAIGFLLLPCIAMLMAHYVTRIFVQRYALTALLGVVLLLFPALARRSAAPRQLGAAMALLFFGCFIASTADEIARSLTAPPPAKVSLEQRPELPLLIASGLLFYPLDHYATPAQANRLHFVTEPSMGRRWTGTDMFDRGYWDLHRLFPLRSNLNTYPDFLARHQKFLVYGYNSNRLDWILSQLLSDGASLRLLGQQQEQVGLASLFEATLPPTLPSTSGRKP